MPDEPATPEAEGTAAPEPPKRKTPLETLLNDEETKAFADYLKIRVESVSAQLSADFIPRREEFEAQMNDDFEWRGGDGNIGNRAAGTLDECVNDIFDLQNDSLNIVGGFAAFMTARTADDIFGTDPYYSLNPEGVEDRDLAEDMQKHSEWKLRTSPFKDAALDSIDLAMGIGEGVIKVHWCRELDVYEVEAEVLHVEGQAVVTVAGEYVYQDDALTPQTTEAPEMAADAMEAEGGEGMAEPMPEPMAMPGGPLVVEKDPSLIIDPAKIEWKAIAIEKTNVSYNGVKAATMHFKDFLCPQTAESVEDSDFVGHRFQMRLAEAVHKFNIPPDIAEKLASESDEAKAEAAKPRDGETSENTAALRPNPMVEFVECWVKYDPKGDGRLRRIYALIAMPLGIMIEMDYIANRTPQGQLPFFVVRAYKVKNRWYGRGYYETYAKAQEFVDRQLNRVEYRNRFHSNPVAFWDHSKLAEDEDSDDLSLEPGRVYQKKGGAKMEEIIEVFTLPDLDERTWQLMQFMIQVIQVRSGVTSAAQGDTSSLPSTSTATGIESILQSASVLARLPMGNIRSALEKALLYAVKLIYANFDRDEVYTYFVGDVQKAKTLEAERVQDVDMNVRLLLTRFKNRESLESAMKVIEVLNLYIAVPEPEKAAVRPGYVQAIKALGFEQADAMVREPLPPMPTQIDPATGQPMVLPPGEEEGGAGMTANLVPPQPTLTGGAKAQPPQLALVG